MPISAALVDAGRLAELVGDDAGQRVAGTEEVRADLLRRADDERHRDRLADRAAEADHHRRRPRRRGCAGTPRRGSSPSASRPSAVGGFLLRRGVVANTSRVSDVMIGVIMIATMIPAVMKLSPVLLGSPNSVFEDGMPPTSRRRRLVDVGQRLARARRAPTARRRPTGSRRAGRRCRRRLRSRRGATSVTNSAMPMLTGTAITSAMMPDEERAVDQRPGAELAVRRIPVVGEDRRSPPSEPRPRLVVRRVRDQARGSRAPADRPPARASGRRGR